MRSDRFQGHPTWGVVTTSRRRAYELETDALLRAGRLKEAAQLLDEFGYDRADGPKTLGWVGLAPTRVAGACPG